MNQPGAGGVSRTALLANFDGELAPIIDLGPLGERVSATPRQTCAALSIGVTKLYELLGNGELSSYKEGKARRILVSSIREYVARRLAASPRAT
jgi:excisionase family DNA binding protein